MFDEYCKTLDASNFLTKRINYITRLKSLLKEIFENYKQLLKDKIKLSKDENKIRDILVDNYFSKNINNYKFKKEKNNNLGRVDIFIEETLLDDKPEFVIECKLLDNKNITGTEGKNAKYIKNGIQRFLTEYYFSYNNFYVNAMIGFIIDKINIDDNINEINNLSKKLFNNSYKIIEPIKLIDKNIYQSKYLTINSKEFIIYHQMMDLSENV
ncbi:hypothetical protein [Aliarcobacter butzleri]|uniref:hypothetical protein n=1 Tax=Aliarcobacter butzleri TaxID=28197 RepID=UPI001EDDC7AD|nr:hypothetical protein [Aliarcobacter butzleri]MCG3694132.1 hypothetical protein [Aliarcobacter butzleri]